MKVFISHVREDQVLAGKVADALRKNGLEVWDSRSILPGDNWAEKVSEALEQSRAMVVLITPGALKSDWVRREIEYALGSENFSGKLISVIVGRLKDIPKDEFPWILRRLNVVEITNPKKEKEAIERIVEALREMPQKRAA
jgi:hypothetical protein